MGPGRRVGVRGGSGQDGVNPEGAPHDALATLAGCSPWHCLAPRSGGPGRACPFGVSGGMAECLSGHDPSRGYDTVVGPDGHSWQASLKPTAHGEDSAVDSRPGPDAQGQPCDMALQSRGRR